MIRIISQQLDPSERNNPYDPEGSPETLNNKLEVWTQKYGWDVKFDRIKGHEIVLISQGKIPSDIGVFDSSRAALRYIASLGYSWDY